MAPRFDPAGWARQEIENFPEFLCSKHHRGFAVVWTTPLRPTFVYDGIPEPGYTPNPIPRLLPEALCSACAETAGRAS